jgi:hypothetical protein
MKWLYLIIRHFWPRPRWREVYRTNVFGHLSNDRPAHIIVTQQDQFGNLRNFKLSP